MNTSMKNLNLWMRWVFKRKTTKNFVQNLKGIFKLNNHKFSSNVTNTRNKKNFTKIKNYKRGPYNRFTEDFKENAILKVE